MIGTQSSWTGTIHNVAFDYASPMPVLFTGNLESGVAVTQPTNSSSPLCIDLNHAGRLTSSLGAAHLDGRYCVTTANGGANRTLGDT
jgi:hypothetical protein